MWVRLNFPIFHWAQGSYTSAKFHRPHSLFYKIPYDWPLSIQVALQAAQKCTCRMVKIKLKKKKCKDLNIKGIENIVQ